MKTQESIDKKRATNFLILFLACTTFAASYLAFDQYSKKDRLQQMIEAEGANMEQHLIDAYAEIERNLSEITAHEGILKANLEGEGPESTLSAEERIRQEIGIIASLMDKNQHIIAGLNSEIGVKDKKLKNYAYQVRKLNGRIKEYIAQAEQLNLTNEELHANLAVIEQANNDLNMRVETMDEEIKKRDKTIIMQGDELVDKENTIHTAYFTVGTYQKLKEANVVEKEGGLIGIGATKTLREDFDRSNFTRIDRRSYTTIPVFSDKAELITNHSPDSYEWTNDEKGVRWIKITKPEKFWENTKYLVIITDNKQEHNVAMAE